MSGQALPLALPLYTPEDHAGILHPAGSAGRATLAYREANGRWREIGVPVGDLPQVLRMFGGAVDVYLTQNRFVNRRRIAHLLHLDALFADLDYRTVPALASLPPEHVLQLALRDLEDGGKPAPSFAVSSGGGGLYLVWLHTPVPRAALPRWNACQREIYQTLRRFGADRRALDAARVLRVVGTRNGKSGAFVEALTRVAPAWPFDALADEWLPLTRAELYDLRIARALRKPTAGPKARPPEGFTLETLWNGRLEDLQKLALLRGWTPIPHGYRDEWLFLAGVAMSWMAPPEVFSRELWQLAHDAGGWDDSESKSRLYSVMQRARAAAAGKTVEWRGQQIDARYHFRTETILERLDITPDEQRQLSTLIGPDVARERHRAKERERKHQAGEVTTDRQTYRAAAAGRAAEAQRLRAEGQSLRAIAEALGASAEGVRRMLARPSGEGVNSPCGCMVAQPAHLTLSGNS